MPLTKAQKVSRVDDLKKEIDSAQHILVGDFSGMDVATATEMRAKLRESQVSYMVVKNSLARLAMKGTDFEALSGSLKGPNGFVMTAGDAAVAAKIMVEFEKTKKTPQIRLGFIDSMIVTASEIRRIAELPPREVLLAQIAAGFQAPVAGLARLLHELTRKLVATLDAVREQKGAA
jgi:large subunit ribosomal protein L10